MRWNTCDYSGWGRTSAARGLLARPERLSDLTELLREAPGPGFGNHRSYGDACLNGTGRGIRMTRLDRILDFEPDTGVVTVEAGLTLGALLDAMAPRGWVPAVLPGTGHATVGGAIAMDVHGKNHHVAGTFGQHVAGLTLIGPGGSRTLTPDDTLFRATIGGLGQTGIIAEARLRLRQAPAGAMRVSERRVPDWDSFIRLLDASAAPHCVGWLDATASGARLGRGILEEAEPDAALAPADRSAWRVPLDAPGFALSAPVVRAFNAAYHARVPARGRSSVKSLRQFHFPLDRLDGWNRLYGKQGFYQFQAVTPADAEPALRALLERIARSGLASPLAVLKRLGPGRAGMMSFPMAGLTLAVDLRACDAARALIAALYRDVAEAGGRIYLAKDALATPQIVQQMYPELTAWRAEVHKADPDGVFATDLTRRLRLRDST